MAQKQICLDSDMGRLIPKIRSTTTSKLDYTFEGEVMIQDTLGSMFIGDPTFVGYSGLRKLWDCMLHWRHFVSSSILYGI